MTQHCSMSLKKVQRAARLVHTQLDKNDNSVEAVALLDNDHPVGLKEDELDLVAKVKELLTAQPSMGYRRLYEHLKQETASACPVKKQREAHMVGTDTSAGEVLDGQYVQCSHEVGDEECDDAGNAGLMDTMKDFYEYSTDADSDADDSNMDSERLLDSDEAASMTTSPAPVPSFALRLNIPIQNMNNGSPCQKSKVEDWKVKQGLVPRPAAEQFAIHTPRIGQSFDIFTPRPEPS